MRVKFHLLPHKVSKLAIQPTTKTKTKLVTSADTLLKPQLWSVDFAQPDLEITQLSELAGHDLNVKVISWSPKGNYLITACDFPILWVDAGDNLKSMGRLHHEASEIHAAEFSPDEKRVVLAAQNNLLYMYEIDTKQQLKRLKLDFIPIGIAWDPLNSYVGVLTTENCLTIYSSNNFEQKKKVSFSLGAQKFSDTKTKRLERKIGWSTDGEYCICPSLEDKNDLPIVCGINRLQNFEITNVFAGPSAAITCISFLDMVFKQEKEFYSVFAMGDSDGNISLWQTKGNNKPLFYIKGGYEDMSIESISWEPNSRMLFASTTKKFILVINYNPNAFGTPLPESEKKYVLENLYGKQGSVPLPMMSQSYLDKRYLESQTPLFQTNGDNLFNLPKTDNQPQGLGLLGSGTPGEARVVTTIQPKKVEIRRKNDPAKPKAFAGDSGQKEPLRATVVGINDSERIEDGESKEIEKEKKKDKEKNKEKGKESKEKESNMEIEEDKTKDQEKGKEGEKKEPRVRPKNNFGQAYEAQAKVEKICFPKLNQGMDNYKVNILEKNVLTVKVDKKVIGGKEAITSKLICLGSMVQNISEVLWTDIIEGKVLMIEHNSDYLCYYTDGHLLYINNIITGKKVELPLMIPNLARMKLNSKNFIMLITEDGGLRVYNFEDKKVLLDENCYSLVKELCPNDPPSADSIYLDDDGIPYICLRPNLVVFYNTDLKAWQKIDGGIFSFGIFKNIPKPFKNQSTSSIMLVNKTTKEKFEDFMKEIAGGEVNPEKLKFDNRISVIRKIEEGMIYAMTRNDVKAYYDCAGVYVAKLAEFQEFNKVRCFIIEDLMKNNNSRDYKFIKSKLTSEEDFTKFINYLLSKLNSNQEIVMNLRKEIDSVIENLNFNNIFKKQQKEGATMP